MAFNGVLHSVKKDSKLKGALFAAASDALGVEVLTCVDAAFAEDPAIDEVGLVFGPPLVAENPAEELEATATRHRAIARASVVLHEHKLGLAFAALPALYSAARSAFRRNLCAGAEADAAALRATRSMLLVNADCYVAWARRKRALLAEGGGDASNTAAAAERELDFTTLVLTQHPKSMETWAHREWALQRALSESAESARRALDPSSSDDSSSRSSSSTTATARRALRLLQRELRVCAKACTDYPRNYYAWTHRLRVCRRLAHGAHKLVAHLTSNELAWSEHWLRSHVSDHAGVTHRQSVVRLCCAAARRARGGGDGSNDKTAAARLLARERRVTLELLGAYPGHEAMWEHRRFVIAAIVERCDGAVAIAAAVAEDAALDGAMAERATDLMPSERRAQRVQRQHAASYRLWRAALERRARERT